MREVVLKRTRVLPSPVFIKANLMLRKLIFLVWVLSLPVAGLAEIKPEGLPESVVLSAEPNPHWVWGPISWMAIQAGFLAC